MSETPKLETEDVGRVASNARLGIKYCCLLSAVYAVVSVVYFIVPNGAAASGVMMGLSIVLAYFALKNTLA